MMPQIILRQLWEAGIRLRLTKDGLSLSAPARCLTPEQRAIVLKHKPALIIYLHEIQATTKDLIQAAMEVCDQYGDNAFARSDMIRECLEMPPHLHSDLLAHFKIKTKN